MRPLLRWLAVISGVMLLGMSASMGAEQNSLTAMMPWEGEGRVFRIAPQKMRFIGAFEGVMYVETADGKLDEAFAECPITLELDLETKARIASGHCMITVSSEDTVFSEWTCTGGPGGCKGDFKLTGGTGEFVEISGSSKLVMRTPLRALVTDMQDGATVHVASGLAVLPKLVYTVKGTK